VAQQLSSPMCRASEAFRRRGRCPRYPQPAKTIGKSAHSRARA
jgi:hypothetical protein